MSKKKKNSKKTVLQWKNNQVRHKPSIEDLLNKIEKLCVNQPIKKIPVVLEISDDELTELFRLSSIDKRMSSRFSSDDFLKLKPIIIEKLKPLLAELPEKQIVQRSKGSVNDKKSIDTYAKIEKHKGFLSFITSNM